MFFRKKAKPATFVDKRWEYRRGTGKLLFNVSVQDYDGRRFDGEVLNLSIGGVGASFHLARDPAMAVDSVVEITVSTEGHPNSIVTPARIAHLGQHDEQHVSYGFEFINTGNLYSQLDEFYASYFNRRRTERARALSDDKVPVVLRWSGGMLQTGVYDLSPRGLGLFVSPEKAVWLEGQDEVAVQIQIPESSRALKGRAWVRHRTPLRDGTLLGFEFDLDDPDGMVRHQEALSEFVRRRERTVDEWKIAP